MHNSEQPEPMLHTDTTDPVHDSPGRQLRVARETAQLSLGQVAAELHLSTDTVSALEEDRYDGLPSAVFVVGYLRAYARLLGLDPDPLLDGYRRLQPANGQQSPLPTSVRPAEPSGSILMPVASLAILVLIAGGVWLWWINQQSGTSTREADVDAVSRDGATEQSARASHIPQPVLPQPPSAAQPDSASGNSTATITPLDVDQPAAPDGTNGSAPGQPPVRTPPPDAPTNDSDQPPADDAPPTSALIAAATSDGGSTATQTERVSPTDGNIVMTFSGPCWVDVRDASGEFKLFGEMSKGDSKTLGGQAPYSIILGNATAVELTVGGEPFDVEAIARGNVARFDLDPAKL